MAARTLGLPFWTACALACGTAGVGGTALAQDRVVFETTHGEMVIELHPDEAPVSVENFLQYVRDGFYDGLVFHRVIPGFVIQGGGFESGMVKRETRPPIENEADNGLLNLRYSLSYARTGDPHSATSQFFINLADNAFLDKANSGDGWGYAVFGRVVEGQEVVDRIGGVETGQHGGFRDVPVEDVVINRARLQ